MDVSTPLTIALLGAIVTVAGYFLTSWLERRRALQLRELEFRLDRYQEFLFALSREHAARTRETHLRFVDSVNVVLLMGSRELLLAIDELVENYNDETGTEDRQGDILRKILWCMRNDLGAPGNKYLSVSRMPLIVPDLRLFENEETESGEETDSASSPQVDSAPRPPSTN